MTLFGWWIRGEGRRAVLFFHGNAGNAADRLERAKILHDRFGLDVFLVDYRGYGRSDGSPSEAGLERDARAIYEAARARGFPPERIVPFGESLGSAVAVGLAAERPCGSASCSRRRFSRSARWRAAHYPFVPGFLIRTRFDNARAIRAIAAPKLFLVAEHDEVVPPEQGPQALRARAAAEDSLRHPGRASQRHVRRRRRALLAGGRRAFLASLD